jgi:hypothetical protein
LTYTVGEPHDTAISFADNTFSFIHNGYGYAIPVEGCRTEVTEEGYRLIPTAKVLLDMAKR